MINIIVNIADMKATDNQEATLVTYSLGSCIGVAIYDPLVKVGGLLHFMLPDSRINPQKARRNPCMFADTALPSLFREAYKLGAKKNRMEVKVAGGSQIIDLSGFFNIGKNNYMALREILSTHGVPIRAEDVGGRGNRTISLEISSGKVLIRTSGGPTREL